MGLATLHAADVFENAAGLDMIELAEQAFVALSRGEVIAPARLSTKVSSAGYLGAMPGALTGDRTFGAKLVSFFPGNAARGFPAIQGFVLLFDPSTGSPRALVDAYSITLLRTAAASAAATKLFAAPDASTLGMLGTGAQARAHIEAISKVRELERVVVWGRSFDKAMRFAGQESARTGLTIVAIEDPSEAGCCSIVCTVTSSATPVLLGEWVSEGAHVNLVGAHSSSTREIDAQGIAQSKLFVDSRAAALSEAGDILLAVSEGVIDASHIRGEVGEVMIGAVHGRSSIRERTAFKSLGHIAQDLIAAEAVVAAATARQLRG